MEIYIHTYINVIYICMCVYIERERKRELSPDMITSPLHHNQTGSRLSQVSPECFCFSFLSGLFSSIFAPFPSLQFFSTTTRSFIVTFRSELFVGNLSNSYKGQLPQQLRRLSSHHQPPFSPHLLHSHQCSFHPLKSLLFFRHQEHSGIKVFVLAPP